MIGGAHRETSVELDELLAVTGPLAETPSIIRAAAERVAGGDEEGVTPRAIGDSAPAPNASASTEGAGHGPPARDPSRRELDPEDLAHHRPVAVGAGADVHGPIDERECAPDELSTEVCVEPDRPAFVLRSRRQVERVEAAEGIGDVERIRAEVDDRCPGDAVAVDLGADPFQLAELDAPADVAVLGERVDDPLRGRDVDRPEAGRRYVLRDERLRGDPPRDRRVPGRPHDARRKRRRGSRAPCEVVPVDEPSAGRPADLRTGTCYEGRGASARVCGQPSRGSACLIGYFAPKPEVRFPLPAGRPDETKHWVELRDVERHAPLAVKDVEEEDARD